jgi:hypothetical protein
VGRRAAWGALVCLAGAPARAQLVSDEVPRAQEVPAREELRRDLEQSRYRLGSLRIAPRLTLQDLGYNSNVNGSPTDPVSDETGTVVLGARLTLPLSAKVALRADVFPAYMWYAHEVERRAFGGRAAGTFLAFLNHLTFVGSAFWERSDAVVSTEVLAVQREDLRGARADLELALARSLSLVGSGDLQRRRYTAGGDQEPLYDYSVNDRKEAAARGGLRLRFSESVDVSAGVEGTWTDFEHDPAERDNESRAVIAGMHVAKPWLTVNLSAAYREGRARNGSTFPGYREPTGSGFVSITVVRPLDLELTGRRRIAYSVGGQPPYFLEELWGGGVRIRAGSRVTLHGSAETGANRYTVGENADPNGRVDDAFVYGGWIQILVTQSITIGASVLHSRYDSNIDAYDRKYNQFGVTLTIGRNFLQ